MGEESDFNGGGYAYPVGSIYMSVNPTSPAELFGGTWEPLDQGRVLIGAGTSHPAGETGGEETHKLTTSEMPSHNHSMDSAGSHSHGGSALSAGSHEHDRGDMNITGRLYLNGTWKETSGKNTGAFSFSSWENSNNVGYTSGSYKAGAYIGFDASDAWTGETSSAGAHTHSLSINSAGSHQHTIDNTGGNGSHNNMPPYLSVYMWKRTA